MILGTAGHIDHGKTALIRVLTGVDTDRLPEEKARGITIDLGFAPLELPGAPRLGVVDVPGHEGLVRTMVAGATGIDLVLLVVAADEGVMPQTREHVAICDLLGIERGVVALTKVDTVDEEMRELAAEEVRELLAATALREAPILPVSSVSGTGIEELRATLAAAAREAQARTPRSGPPRLPVDRSFAARGFGTVVTGTLIGSPLSVGDGVEVHPGGARARVRGLQTHGASMQTLEPGARCAVNLQGVEVRALSRGRVVTTPGALVPTHVLDVSVRWLPNAPPCEPEGAAIEFLSGTAERVGRLAPIGPGTEPLAPGEPGFARIHLKGEPVPLLPGDRFVARGFSRNERFGATLGGGVVLDVAPPRRRRSDPVLRRELEALARREPENDVALRISRAGFRGVSQAALRAETGQAPRILTEHLARLAERGAIGAAGEAWLDEGSLQELEGRVETALVAFHEREPLRPGMPRAALRGALPENSAEAVLDLLLSRLAGQGRLVAEGQLVRCPDHAPRLDADQEKIVAEVRRSAAESALEPPTLREWSSRFGLTPEDMRPLLVHLEREGDLVRAPGELWFHRDAIERLRDRVIERIRESGPLATPAYKDLIGTTRKHAVPLMELFDAEGITFRKGDVRVLRRG
jgi:selenocysteine-specific elongation factor